MALSRISKTRRTLFKLINPITINPYDLLYLSFAKIITPSPFSTHIPFNNSEHADVADGLISIFTKRPFSPENPELKRLAPVLTTNLVETVLNNLKSWKIAHLFFTWVSNQHGYKHNCYTYTAMASILSRARQNAALKDLALDFINSNCSITPGGLGFFLRRLGSLGLVDEANILFDQVKKKGLCVPNNYSYNCLLEAISQSSSIDLLEMRFQEMLDSGWEINMYTLTPILRAYSNAGKFEKALNIFHQMLERNWVDAHVFSILILSFSKWGEVDKAFEFIERMEDHNLLLNEKTFYVLVNGFVKGSRVDKALQLFSKMQKSGFGVDVALYDVLIGGLCENKELEKALSLYSEMKEMGIRPDVGIVAKLISCCSSEKDMIQLLVEAKENMDEEGVIWLYNYVLKCLINMGLVDKAHVLLRTITGDESDDGFTMKKHLKINSHPITSWFRTVIEGLLKTGKLDLTLCLIKDMIQIGCKPDILIYNNLIDKLCNSNRLEESYELLRDMEDSGLEPTQFTHNSLYGCLCRRENVAEALELLKRMRIHRHEPWMKYSTLLVKRLCTHRKVVEACNFLHDMLQEGFLPDIITYSAAMDGLVKSKELNRALDLFKDICARGSFPDVVAYNTLINGLCKAKRISEAENLVNEMVLKGLVPSVVTYNLLIDGWCKVGAIDRAMHCLSTMFDLERDPSVITYTTLIDGLCAAGRPDDALKLWEDIKGDECAPNRIVFMALICGLSKCNRPDTALVYLRKMEEMEMKPDSFVYITLLSAFLSNSNMSKAFDILKEMFEKGSVPEQADKNHSIVRDAILKLLADDITFSSVKALIAEGNIPSINLSDFGSEDQS
ncbi:putative pentatricopeptide repeat-containing protein At5g08310, mitochondrial [Humulus lupulus]|uniref:putative pentatricopeptide repeat-containing protein At5g08310, mitochondrial n=1 Tax=Humulus lupulus TaxID=3486 RepID=UPI002B4183D5|nr:putative pentatricopeptide repeat-containing protein At5g08310, mitochondrial [Humulus lupulus]